jgi:uncharacterized membrane protein YhfC
MKLTAIAAEMRAHIARADGTAYQRLGGGLEVILVRTGEQLMLTLRRMEVAPSDVEVTILRGAFAVPTDAPAQLFAHRITSPATGENALYRSVTLTWRER